MPKQSELLKHLVGYVEGRERIAEREQSGTDFSEDKGKNNAEIAKLHPKRLSLKVTEIFQETPSTKTFRFVSTKGNLLFGQQLDQLPLLLAGTELGSVHTVTDVENRFL